MYLRTARPASRVLLTTPDPTDYIISKQSNNSMYMVRASQHTSQLPHNQMVGNIMCKYYTTIYTIAIASFL